MVPMSGSCCPSDLTFLFLGPKSNFIFGVFWVMTSGARGSLLRVLVDHA